jgi:subtilase family serine protease
MKALRALLAAAILIVPGAPSIGQIKAPPKAMPQKPKLNTPGAALPDLVLTRFELRPAKGATINDPISVFVEITNRGLLPAVFKPGEAYVELTLPGREALWKWTTSKELTVTPERPLTSGQTVLLPGQVPAGTYDLTAKADPDDRVKENDETNNEAGLTWTIVAAEKPDLVISEVYSQQVKIGEDVALNIVATVKNTGRGNAFIPYKTKILDCPEMNGSVVAENDTTLKPGDTKRMVLTWLKAVGSRPLTLIVDPNDAIMEADETNNTRAFLAQVK